MSLPVCKFYSQNRNCKFGKNCRYLHSSFQGPPDISHDNHHEAVRSSTNLPHLSSDLLNPVPEPSQQSCHEIPINSTLPAAFPASDSLAANSKSNYGNHTLSSLRSEPEGPKKVCHYYFQHGRCAFGRNCRFLHHGGNNQLQRPNDAQRRDVPPRFQRKTKTSTTGEVRTTEGEEKTAVSVEGTSDPKSNKETVNTYLPKKNVRTKTADERQGLMKICSYFKSGTCRRGNSCRYSHSLASLKCNDSKNPEDEKENDKLDPDESKKAERQPIYVKKSIHERPRAQKPPVIPQFIKLSDLEADGTEKYRKLDIHFLQKRFGDWRNKTETYNENDDFKIDVSFEPSDPDWPFDIKIFQLELVLPKSYPKEPMIVRVPLDKQDLPETVRRYLEVSFSEWISDREKKLHKDEKVELMVRPFFKWIDRNIEDVVTESLRQLKRELTAKAAGMEFIPADQLKAKYNATESAGEEGTVSEESDSEDSLGEESDSSDECLNSDTENDSSDDDEKENKNEERLSLNLEAEKKGTEIQLRSLQLKQNATSLMFEKLRLILQCARCKNHSELTIVRGKVMSLSCEKCSHNMFVCYRPSLAHQFSSVIGYLDLESCQAFDLIFQDCTIVVSCFGCGKMTKLNGMVSGQMTDTWCQACNARLKFATESVKFYHLEPSSIDLEKGRVEVVRNNNKKKPPKDPAIKEGYPLPEFGACKHYKQSYRWLRFPCCGKAYPCDVCHDRKEDHEMVMATRMICGHCCKEQNFSGKQACTSCNQHVTKVHSAHWEGGTGCRDKITMSRSDQQKYKNMNKTLSNHKKKVQGSGSKKKTTKLRHA